MHIAPSWSSTSTARIGVGCTRANRHRRRHTKKSAVPESTTKAVLPTAIPSSTAGKSYEVTAPAAAEADTNAVAVADAPKDPGAMDEPLLRKEAVAEAKEDADEEADEVADNAADKVAEKEAEEVADDVADEVADEVADKVGEFVPVEESEPVNDGVLEKGQLPS